MGSFEELSLLERIRRERFVRARNRHLRQALLVKRNLIEARLEERRLQYLASLPGFGELSEETRGLVSFLYVRRRSMFLAQAAHGIQKRNVAEKKLAQLCQAVAGGEES
jgi:hypothetical protein